MEELSGINMQKIIDQAWSMILQYGPKLLLAIILIIVGLLLIKQLVKLAEKGMKLSITDTTLASIIKTIVEWSLKIMLFLAIASMIGIKTNSFLAIFTASYLAFALALEGSLSNLAGGIILLIFKPYKIGDRIKAQGAIGKVKSIQFFNTTLITNDNKKVIVPNGAMANGSIINYTTEGKIRVDLSALISIDYDLRKVKEILMTVLKSDPKVLKDPAPFVGVNGMDLAESSVNFTLFPWARVDDYWAVYFGINEKIKIALEEEGISIPELKWTDVMIK